jgi:hypothetical protein
MELLLSSLSLAAVAEVALIRFVAFAAQITKKNSYSYRKS